MPSAASSTRRSRAAAVAAAAALSGLANGASSLDPAAEELESSAASSSRPRKRRITAYLQPRAVEAEPEEEPEPELPPAQEPDDEYVEVPASTPRSSRPSMVVKIGKRSAAKRSATINRKNAATGKSAANADSDSEAQAHVDSDTAVEEGAQTPAGTATETREDEQEAQQNDEDADEGAEEGGEEDDEDADEEDGEGMVEEVRTISIDGTEYTQKGDSLILPSDEAGDTKVDEKGRLYGGRVYKFPVFQLPNRADPEKLYVLSIDAARSAGYRDSLYFYRNNKRLLKLTLNLAEKEMLIARSRLSMQLRTRNVTATSVLNVFKTHGARVVKAGRTVTDDYYEAAARASGRREGERVRMEGGRDRGLDADIFGLTGGGGGGAGGLYGVGGSGAEFEAGPSFGYGPSSSTLTSVRNKRIDSNVHSFPDPNTGQPLLTIFGDAGLSPWVRIEEGPRAGQTMRRKMLNNLDIDDENWMREAAYMVIGMNRELEDGRRDRMSRLLGNGAGMRSLADEAAEDRRKKMEQLEADNAAAEAAATLANGGSYANPALAAKSGIVPSMHPNGPGNPNVKSERGSQPSASSLSHAATALALGTASQQDSADGVSSPFIPTAVMGSASAASSSSRPRMGPIGVYEPVTAVFHVPESTQPTRARWTREDDIPRLSTAATATDPQGKGKGRVTGGYLAGTRVGSGAWGLASVSTKLDLRALEAGSGSVAAQFGYRVIPAGASEKDVEG
ncbi:chromatin structure-remodeling complex subunit RSC7 [Tilletia horrida]|nr:chromatin structure-remodeling complex subunit RSC7 [Tilletia horrida]